MSETKETKIKRLGQFLFDHAGFILAEMEKSDNYRSVTIALDMFKTDGEKKLQISLSFYDSTHTHCYLRGNAIGIYKFNQLCKQVNEETGNAPVPKPVEVREKL